MNLDPTEPTEIGPGLAAIPLHPTPWDDLDDGTRAVTRNGVVWERRAGMWHRSPWWQGSDGDEIIAICADPDDWAYDLPYSRAHVEEAYGPLAPVVLP